MLLNICKIRYKLHLVGLLLSAIFLSGCNNYIFPEAEKRFEARTGPFSVTVYPVNVINPMDHPPIDHDTELADKIAEFLNAEGQAKALLTDTPVRYTFEPSPSQPKMAAAGARALSAQVIKDGIKTEYALLVEILEGRTELHGVHFYLSDSSGQLANGGLTNSHWEEFKEVQPKDREGGYEVAIRMLRRKWKQ
jgi:hypothetical protein